jgi:HK97 family phage major capsid protein
MDTKALIEKRKTLSEQGKALLDRAAREKRALNAEEQSSFDKMHEEIMSLKGTIDRSAAQEAEEREQDQAREAEERRLAESRGRQTQTSIVAPTAEEDRREGFRAWALGGHRKHVSDAQLEAARRAGIDPNQRELEVRALNSTTATQGLNVIPDEMMRAFWDVQKWFGSVRSLATGIRTATGASLPIPKGDDTANTGAIVADSGAVVTTVDPSFGQVVLGAYKFSSKAVIVSVELLQDANINVAQYLGQKLGQRIGRAQNTYFTTGTGTGEPNGVQVAAALGKTAAATNAITFDEVIDLMHSVDIAYRAGASFMVHDTVAAYLRKLKDSQNRYLWEMSLQAGQPDRIFGKPVAINNDMDSAFSTNKRLVLFGDFSAYHVRDAGDVVIARGDELFLLNHQVVFVAFQRSDGNLIDTTAVKYLRTA